MAASTTVKVEEFVSYDQNTSVNYRLVYKMILLTPTVLVVFTFVELCFVILHTPMIAVNVMFAVFETCFRCFSLVGLWLSFYQQ